jgi:hypothetical protein
MKKIFYGAAIQGARNRQDRAHVHKIAIQAIKHAGYDVLSEHTVGTNINDTARLLEKTLGPLPPAGKQRTIFVRNKMIELIEGDIEAAIFEVSTPSLGTGIEIAHAYLRPRMGLSHIPVTALYQKNYWPNHLSSMINGISSKHVPGFNIIEYDNPEDIPTIIYDIVTSCF